jgi:hypothetical protein
MGLKKRTRFFFLPPEEKPQRKSMEKSLVFSLRRLFFHLDAPPFEKIIFARQPNPRLDFPFRREGQLRHS